MNYLIIFTEISFSPETSNFTKTKLQVGHVCIISVRNWHFTTEERIPMRFLIEPVYCMTWIWTFHRAHNKLKSPIKEDNIWATVTLTSA